MTKTLNSTRINGMYIYIEHDMHSGLYIVEACPIQSETMCGYPYSSNRYGTIQAAKRQYNALIRRYKEA